MEFLLLCLCCELFIGPVSTAYCCALRRPRRHSLATTVDVHALTSLQGNAGQSSRWFLLLFRKHVVLKRLKCNNTKEHYHDAHSTLTDYIPIFHKCTLTQNRNEKMDGNQLKPKQKHYSNKFLTSCLCSGTAKWGVALQLKRDQHDCRASID